MLQNVYNDKDRQDKFLGYIIKLQIHEQINAHFNETDKNDIKE